MSRSSACRRNARLTPQVRDRRRDILKMAVKAMLREVEHRQGSISPLRPAHLRYRAGARIDAGCPGSFSVTPVAVSLPSAIRNTSRFWSM